MSKETNAELMEMFLEWLNLNYKQFPNHDGIRHSINQDFNFIITEYSYTIHFKVFTKTGVEELSINKQDFCDKLANKEDIFQWLIEEHFRVRSERIRLKKERSKKVNDYFSYLKESWNDL